MEDYSNLAVAEKRGAVGDTRLKREGYGIIRVRRAAREYVIEW